MQKTVLIVALLIVSISISFAEETEQRSIKNENIGNVTLITPKDWIPSERHHINFGTTFYRLTPPKKDFDFEILLNDLKHMRMEALVNKDLERYIESNMATAVPQSTEGKVTAKRFGIKRDGVYARLTDKSPNPGEPLYFTQGVRLLGKEVVLFTLYSNDKDESILKKVLDIVDSVKTATKPNI